MTYMNLVTFDLIESKTAISRFSDYVRVDTLIAQTLQAFNTRGYRTVASRAGDGYDMLKRTKLNNVRDTSGALLTPMAVLNAYHARYPRSHVVDVIKSGWHSYEVTEHDDTRERKTYIRFDMEYAFGKLPPETELVDCTLVHHYDQTLSGIDFYVECAKYNQMLFDWACTLPMSLRF